MDLGGEEPVAAAAAVNPAYFYIEMHSVHHRCLTCDTSYSQDYELCSLNPIVSGLLLTSQALCSPSPVVCGRVFAWCYITLLAVTEYPWPDTDSWHRELENSEKYRYNIAFRIERRNWTVMNLLVLTVIV